MLSDTAGIKNDTHFCDDKKGENWISIDGSIDGIE